MPTRIRFTHSTTRILFAVTASIVSLTALAQTPPDATISLPQLTIQPQPSVLDPKLFQSPNLTGDWFGARAELEESGINFGLSSTQFYQGLTQGGLEQGFRYGGRNDYFMNVDGEKVGLWEGSSLTLHGETRYGESVNSLTGALSPANLLLSVPSSSGSASGLTAVKFTQMLSEDTLIYAGKINTLDDFKQPLTGAGPLTGFLNSAMIYNPVYARTIPYSTLGAGFAYLKNAERIFEIALYDTNNTPTVSGLSTLFNNGVTIFAQGTILTAMFDRPGHQGISGTFSTGTYSDLTPTAYLDPVAGLSLVSTPQKGSWCLAYNFDQALYVSPDDSQRQWGVFGNLGIADDNPSPVRWFANSGISGTSPIATRKSDSFGMAYFYIGTSNNLKNLAPNLLELRDEYGVELYYNVAVTRWCQITPDLQMITPFRERAESSVVVGLRAKINF